MTVQIVLDTSVLVPGLRSRNGPNNALLREIAKGTLLMLCTPPLFLEYVDVLRLNGRSRGMFMASAPDKLMSFLQAWLP